MIRDIIILYLIGINLFAFLMYGLDKQKAKQRKWRISERILLLLAAAGGSAGAYAGMLVFRHKTRHLKFRIGVPLILVIHCILIYLTGSIFR